MNHFNLKELLKRTRETSTDYENLKQALAKIEAVVIYVNEDKRSKERSARSMEILRGVIGFEDVVPVRQLLKEGELTIISSSIMKKPTDSKESKKPSKKILYCFLFADLFLITKPKSGGGPLLGNKRGSLQFRGQLDLQGCYFFDVPDQRGIIFFIFSFSLFYENPNSFLFFFLKSINSFLLFEKEMKPK